MKKSNEKDSELRVRRIFVRRIFPSEQELLERKKTSFLKPTLNKVMISSYIFLLIGFIPVSWLPSPLFGIYSLFFAHVLTSGETAENLLIVAVIFFLLFIQAFIPYVIVAAMSKK